MVKLPFWCKIAKFCDKIDYPPRRIQIFNSQGVKSATLQRHKQHLLPDYQQCYTPLLIVISLLWKAPQKTRKHPFLTTKCIKNHYHCPQNRLKWQEKALFRIFLLLFRGGQLATSTLAHHKKTPGAVIEIIDYLRPCHQPPLHPTFFQAPEAWPEKFSILTELIYLPQPPKIRHLDQSPHNHLSPKEWLGVARNG